MVEKKIQNRDDIAGSFIERELKYDKLTVPEGFQKGSTMDDKKNRDDIVNTFVGRELDKGYLFDMSSEKVLSPRTEKTLQRERKRNCDNLNGTLLQRELYNDKYAEYGMYRKTDSHRRHSVHGRSELENLNLTDEQKMEIQRSMEKPIIQSAANAAIKKSRKMFHAVSHPFADHSNKNSVSESGDNNFDDLSNTFLASTINKQDSKQYKTKLTDKVFHVVDHYAEKFLDFFSPPVALPHDQQVKKVTTTTTTTTTKKETTNDTTDLFPPPRI